MKLLIIFLVGAICISQIEAKPGIFDFVGNIASDVGSGVNHIIGTTTGFFGNVSDKFNSFRESMNKYWASAMEKFDEFRKNVGESFADFNDELKKNFNSAKKQIERFTDEASKKIFAEFQKGWEGARRKFEEVSELGAEKFQELSEKAKKSFEKLYGDVKEYRTKLEDKARKLSASARKKAEAIINQFEKDVAEIIEKCRGKTMEPIKGFFEYSKNVLSKTQKQFSGIANQIRECYYDDAQNECGEKLKAGGEEAWTLLKEQASGLKDKIVETSYEELAGVVCMSDTISEIRRRRDKAQNDIEKL